MTYNPNLPQASDKIRNFPADVTTNNWPRLQTIVSADHQFNLAAATNDGYHKIIHFVNQAGAFGDGTPVPISGVAQLYTKTIVGEQHLFLMPGTASNAVTDEQPISPCVARAYVNFDGTGAVGNQALRSAFNVLTVNKTGTGRYTISWAIAMPSSAGVAQYCPLITGGRSSGPNVFGQVATGAYNTNVTTTALNIEFYNDNGSHVDVNVGSVIIFTGVN